MKIYSPNKDSNLLKDMVINDSELSINNLTIFLFYYIMYIINVPMEL